LLYPIGPALAATFQKGEILQRLSHTGPMTAAERRVGLVFVVAAVLWVTRPLLNRLPGLENLSDPGIALVSASALFLIPSGVGGDRRFLLTWTETREIPWQVLILFGGGLSLAAAMDRSGLALWIGEGFAGISAMPPLLVLLLLTATVLLLTEMVSNTAIVAALLPIVGTIAASTGMDVRMIAAAVAMSASCAFMLPVATPPNALVFATGHVRVVDMVRAGLVMNLLSVMLVSLAAFALAPLLSE
jgi:sodium-dependent dicarboxylate transporter 2/3/5